MTDHKHLLDKSNKANLSDSPVSDFMIEAVALKESYTIKSTIETFRVHHLSGAPVINFEKKVIGVISEYDLLIQAASKPLSSKIEYKTSVIGIEPETTLKEVIVLLYKHKLKWMPVTNSEGYLKGVISRIDVLNFIAKNS